MALSQRSVRKERLAARRELRATAPAVQATSRKSRLFGLWAAVRREKLTGTLPAVRLPPISRHAGWRIARRHLDHEALALALVFGTALHRAGAIFHLVRRKDARWDGSLGRQIEQLHGTTVVLDCSQGVILTAYRSRNAHRHLRQKPRRSTRSQNPA